MRNLISGDFELTPDRWILSILRHKNSGHAFLILEGLDSENNRDIRRAELIYGDLNAGKIKCLPYCLLVLTEGEEVIEKIREAAQKGEFCYQSYPIDAEKKDEFWATVQKEEKLYEEQHHVPYVMFGNMNTLAGGFFGSSIEMVGGQSSKLASIEANYAKPTNLCVDSSIDATLQRGHNCVSWASEKMQQFCPDYKPSLLGQLFVSVPQIELAEKQNNTSCVMM